MSSVIDIILTSGHHTTLHRIKARNVLQEGNKETFCQKIEINHLFMNKMLLQKFISYLKT